MFNVNTWLLLDTICCEVFAVAYIFYMIYKEVGNILITMINISRVHYSIKRKPVTDWMLADKTAQKISGILWALWSCRVICMQPIRQSWQITKSGQFNSAAIISLSAWWQSNGQTIKSALRMSENVLWIQCGPNITWWFSHDIHDRKSIAHVPGQSMGSLLWGQNLIYLNSFTMLCLMHAVLYWSLLQWDPTHT